MPGTQHVATGRFAVPCPVGPWNEGVATLPARRSSGFRLRFQCYSSLWEGRSLLRGGPSAVGPHAKTRGRQGAARRVSHGNTRKRHGRKGVGIWEDPENGKRSILPCISVANAIAQDRPLTPSPSALRSSGARGASLKPNNTSPLPVFVSLCPRTIAHYQTAVRLGRKCPPLRSPQPAANNSCSTPLRHLGK